MTTNTLKSEIGRLMGSRAVREILGEISDMTLWRWCRSGVLPMPRKIGGRNFWNESDIRRVATEGSSPEREAA